MRTRDDFRPYQHQAVEFVKQHQNCALFMEMGLGKTVTAATAFLDMRDSFDARHMLIVAPLRVARDVWHHELQEWAHTKHLTVQRMFGEKIKRVSALRTPADIHTINRENFAWLTEQFIEGKKQILRWPWDMVVLDESSSFRSQSAERWKALKRIRKLFPRMVQLTGTPTPNGAGGLWAQMRVLDGGERLGRTETEFKNRWFNPPLYYEFGKWTLKPGAFAEIMAAVSDICFSLRTEDYLDLPPVVTNVIKVRLHSGLKAQYAKLERTAILKTFTGSTFVAANAGVLAGKLLQLANGAMYTDDEGNYDVLHDEKIKALLDLLDTAEGPTLIAYNFRSDLERIQKALRPFCKENGKRFEVLKTEQSVREWNAGLIDYLLLHPGSAGHGLNLQHSGSETIIWFGNTYDAELHDQTNARLTGGNRRIGKNIVVNYLVSEGTIDEDVMQALGEKRLSQDQLMIALSRRAGETMQALTPTRR